MQIRYHCPTDKCVAIIEYEPLEESGDSMRCPRCKQDHAMTISQSVKTENIADQCAVCGGRELFVKKDFPQALGLFIVVAFGLAAIYFMRTSVVIGWTILASAAFLDLAIYLLIGRVTVCYACRAEYRKCKLSPTHEGFDLATSEKY